MNSLQNLIELYHLIVEHSDNKILKHKEYKAINTPNSSWPNMIYNLSCKPDQLGELIRTIKARIDKKELPQYLMLAQEELTNEMLAQLKALSVVNRQWAYMTLPLNKKLVLETKPNFRIEVVNTNEQLDLWVKTAEDGLMQGKNLDYEIFRGILGHKAVEYYLGYENNIPVATSMLFVSGQIAGVYMIGTIEKYRQKGYGTAVTNYVLKRGFELGCGSSVLQATQAGEKVYSKIGFKTEEQIELFDLKDS